MAARVAACFHGFLRTGGSMWPVRRRLLREGYADVACPTYNYAGGTLDDHAQAAAQLIADLSEAHDGARVDVVTHSMGGLLARAALAHQPPIGRIVMLAPPNQGAELAQTVRGWLPVHQLGWDPLAPLLPGAPDALPVPQGQVEVGILTGGTGDDGGFLGFLTGDNDGKVRVTEARLPGAADFKVVPYGHTFVMARAEVLDLLVDFLDNGLFDDSAPKEAVAPDLDVSPTTP